MTEHRHLIVTSVTAAPESSAPEPVDAFGLTPSDYARAEHLKRTHRAGTVLAIQGYNRRIAKGGQFADDERAKAALATKQARRRTTLPQDERTPVVPYEHEEQAELLRWCRKHRITYVVNLAGLNKSFEGRLAARRAGMRRGDPDVAITTPPPGRPAARVYVEMKRRKPLGKAPSPEQVERLDELRAQGDLAEVHYGAASAIRWLSGLYGVRP